MGEGDVRNNGGHVKRQDSYSGTVGCCAGDPTCFAGDPTLLACNIADMQERRKCQEQWRTCQKARQIQKSNSCTSISRPSLYLYCPVPGGRSLQ